MIDGITVSATTVKLHAAIEQLRLANERNQELLDENNQQQEEHEAEIRQLKASSEARIDELIAATAKAAKKHNDEMEAALEAHQTLIEELP